ncbi:hypothetical protein ACFWVB_02565 [Streptomyces microflavus]|uniref:hypothetical protein n=1 Tax=Streptomyces microflavus TaxID=1919 RepID=UPI00366836F0
MTTTPEQSPDTSGQCPDTRGGTVRTPFAVGESADCGPLPTRADAVRTRPDTPRPDTPDGVRIEYRATVPRSLVAAAFLEGLAEISRATTDQTPRTTAVLKIPTLFVRDLDARPAHVLPQVTPGCEWVVEGEGVPTRKWDGVCFMLDDNGGWWARREVKPGKTPPENFIQVAYDETTKKAYGWEPAGQTGWRDIHTEAVANSYSPNRPGTYELVGPLVNGNPEEYEGHLLLAHGWAPFAARVDLLHAPRDYVGLHQWLHARRYEGIVWHHPDGRMAKIKANDFPRP